jgi:hypothetical protein
MNFRRILFQALVSGLVFFTMVNTRFDAINKGFDSMLNLCRTEFNRVNEVLDSYIKRARG